MSMIDSFKFTGPDFDGKGVSSMPDVVVGNPNDTKAKFDELVKDVVAERINEILDTLSRKGSAGPGLRPGAASIGAMIGYPDEEPAHMNVQDALGWLATQVMSLKNSSNLDIPVGTVSLFAAAPADERWLLCNGDAVFRVGVNADLFAAIGTTYGSGDGTTTFNLPNMTGNAVSVGGNTMYYYIKLKY